MGKTQDQNAQDIQESRRARLAALRLKQENAQCVDCRARSPTWAAVHHGCFLCMDCAARHRKMGVHISFVRSTTLDSWTEEHTVRMEVGGNGKASAFWKQNGMDSVQMRVERYHHALSTQYRAQLTKLAQSSTTLAAKNGPKKKEAEAGEEEGEVNDRRSPELQKEEAAAGSESQPGQPVSADSQEAPPLSVAVPQRPKPVRAADITGTVGRRPKALGKKGLGGRKVPAGSVKEAAPPSNSADQQPAAAPAPAPSPAAPSSATPSSKQRKPDYSGMGSGPQQDSTHPSANLITTGERSLSGADFTGMGTQSAQNVDLEAVGWRVGQAFSNANEAISQKIDKVGGQVKSFLDDL